MTQVMLNLDELTKGLTTKSDKIRSLGRAGVPTSEIARYLGIRYQHARNVLADAGMQGRQQSAPPAEASCQPFKDPYQKLGVWLKIGADGGLAIPAEFLTAAGLRPGGQVHVRLNGDALELLSQKAALHRVHEIVSKYVKPGESLVDELIAERRAEAQRELEGK